MQVHADKLSEAISTELKRGITLWNAKGYYSGSHRKILYVVVNRFEIARLKSIVAELDEKAFVSIIEVSEIMGESKMYGNKPKKSRIEKAVEKSKHTQMEIEVEKYER